MKIIASATVLTTLLVTSNIAISCAFIISPVTRMAPSFYTRIDTTLKVEREKSLRGKIEEKNSLVDPKDELMYSSTIGAGQALASSRNETITSSVQDVFSPDMDESTDATSSNKVDETTKQLVSEKLLKKIERVTKPRAYPLFLAEKGAIIFEDMVGEMEKTFGKRNEDVQITIDGHNTVNTVKEKIAVLGTGWGAAAFLHDIDTSRFDVTVISPRNFFLFTPMLAGASVGTVEYRSITENIRQLNLKANYLEATATEIDPKTKTISCESVVCEGNSCEIEDFTISYDKVVITVGAQTNTFGIPGVREHCCFLKQVEDARRIRTSIVNCFERANLPSLTDKQRESILTFAVIGAGPTGVEFASELRDFIEQDGPTYYPDLLKYVRIKVIEASPTVLAPFDKTLQEEAIRQLTRNITTDKYALKLLPERFQLTELLLNSGVKEVKDNVICLNDGRTIPYGLAVWAAGNGPLPITLDLIEKIVEDEDNGLQAEAQIIARGRVAIDPWLRVLGSDGSILALGDCSCITSGQLPATAQVASQQGEFLARMISQNYNLTPGTDPTGTILLPPQVDPNRKMVLSEKISAFACQADGVAAPFQFLNLGILAYTGGGSALAQLQIAPTEKARVKGTGKIGFGLWRSVYISKQVSWRNRILVLVDWTKAQIFGRDITRL